MHFVKVWLTCRRARSRQCLASANRSGTAAAAIESPITTTYYNWRNKYGGLLPFEMKKENGKLKKIVADLSLDKDMAPFPRRPNWSNSGFQLLQRRNSRLARIHLAALPQINIRQSTRFR
jgi:hypothetical protein